MTRSLVIGVVAVLAAAAAAGDEAAPAVDGGLAGDFRTGSWTPVAVAWPEDAAAPEPGREVFVSIEDADGQWVRLPAATVARSSSGRPTARVIGRFGRPRGRVLVESSPGSVATLACGPPLPATDAVIMVVGDLPSLARAARLLASADGSRPRVTRYRPGAAGPDIDPRAFDGVDALVMCGAEAASIDAAGLAGIDGWVRRGGRLVLLAGASAAALAKNGGTAAAWLPGTVARMVPLRRLAAIETYAHSSRPLDRSALDGLQVPLFEDPGSIEGVVDVHDGPTAADTPLLVRRGHGLGTIAWVGLDLDAAGFRTWQAADTLLVKLLGFEAGRAATPRAGRAGETSRLVLDLAGQLRRAIDRFPGVRPVPFELVALLGATIIGCLYPLSFWLCRAAPPWRAWLTLPAMAAALAAAVWGIGHRWHGIAWQRSAASVVDIDGVSRLARGTGWAGVWSPGNDALDIAAAPPAMLLADSADAAISWWADSGRGLGATDAPVAHPSLAAAPYGYSGSLARLERVPIAASSSRLFEADWVATLSASPVTCSLVREPQGTLRGTVVHHLPFPLEQCVLVHAGWLYDVGRLEPGIAFDPASGRGPRSLASALTRRTQAKDRDVAIRWDTSDTDVARILEIAGFHAAAGGSGFTSLDPGRLARLDLSPLLEVDRVILAGTGPAGVDWTISRQAGADVPPPSSAPAMWRIVMPLTPPAAQPPRESP